MLAFYINNVPLVLDAGTSIRITYYNPACFFDEIPGDVAEGISLPLNETNRAVLAHVHRFDNYSNNKTREFPNFEIRYHGKLLISGTLVVTNTTDTITGWCRSNVGNLGQIHRDKFIYDIPAFNQVIFFNNKANYNPLTDPYGCPTVLNTAFFKDKGPVVELTKKVENPDYVDLTGWETFWQNVIMKKDLQQPYLNEPYKTEALTAAFARSTAYQVNSLNPDNTVSVLSSIAPIKNFHKELFVNVLSPMLFLNYIMTMLLRDAHFFIDKNAIADHPDLQKLILYNNFDITHVEFETGFVYDRTGSYYDEGWEEWILMEAQTAYSILNLKRSCDASFLYRDLIPKMDIKTFILGVQNLLNVCFLFRPGGKVDIIDRETIIDSTPIDISKYLVGDWDLGEKKDVTLKFMFSHDSNDLMFSENWTDIDDLRNMEKESLTSMNDLEYLDPDIGEIRYIIENNIYVRYEWKSQLQTDPKNGNEVSVETLDWRILSSGFQNGFFNRHKNDQEEIKTCFSTLVTGQSTITKQKGNLETMKYAYENFSPRLMFYIGDNVAKNKTDNITIDWEQTEKGLLDTRWPKWNRFWCLRQPVAIQAALPINMIDYVSRNITNRFSSYEGNFIVETLQTEYSINSIGNTKITGYKSAYSPQTFQLDEHWNYSNLILDDTLIDFKKMDLLYSPNLDLFPFGTL